MSGDAAGRVRIARFGRTVHLGLQWAGMAALVVLLVATGLGVVGRYFHISGVTWSFELLAIMFLWITALGTVVAELAGENVSIDGTTTDRGPFFRTYHALVLLLVSAALVWSGWAMLRRTGYMPTPVMRIPSWTMQGIVIFMGVCLGVVSLLRLFRIIR
ncbi:TRAP transporter small permease subunit [Bosea sp. 117]|uniref:TRAP transporter small permease n=1 Tax=Bosea sp. 117 TaxID=1125973 RepID=UPI0009DFC5A8|nr:TRAP transporter small permease subunit [Bosea sp. 117]